MPSLEIQMPPADRAALVELWSLGLPLAHVVERMGYHRAVIRRVIREMGLTRPHPADWTPAEDAIIRAFWGTRSTTELLPFLPGRSGQAIRNRANRLGIVVGRGSRKPLGQNEPAKRLREPSSRLGTLCPPTITHRTASSPALMTTEA
jgi:hypothetical protein